MTIFIYFWYLYILAPSVCAQQRGIFVLKREKNTSAMVKHLSDKNLLLKLTLQCEPFLFATNSTTKIRYKNDPVPKS